MQTLEGIKKNIASIAEEFTVKRVDLFGSYASGSATEESDVDLLVEFMETPVSLFLISGVKVRLEELLQTEVDVIRAPLSPESYITIDRSICVYES